MCAKISLYLWNHFLLFISHSLDVELHDTTQLCRIARGRIARGDSNSCPKNVGDNTII